MKKIVAILILASIIGIGFTLLGLYNSQDNIINGFTVIGLCILLGLAVKTMDLLIDEVKVKSYKIWIIPLGIFIPTSMVYLALTEEPVIGMVIGAALGLLIAGKLDHPMYKVSVILFVILIIIIFWLNMLDIKTTTFYIIPVAAIGSFLDEVGHEKWKGNQNIIKFMFKHRFFLKSFAFLGFVLSFANIFHLLGFLCFDIFYDITDLAFQNTKVSKKTIAA